MPSYCQCKQGLIECIEYPLPEGAAVALYDRSIEQRRYVDVLRMATIERYLLG